MRYVLALDQGTTSSRAIIFDQEAGIVASAQEEFPQLYPEPGWVEHSPREIWESQRRVAREALRLSGLAADKLSAIGIANQRETTILWDRQTGAPIANAIVGQDRRTAAACAELKEVGAESLVRERTGLVLDPYFSATKIGWLLDNIPGARDRAERGELAFGTVDTWLAWNLSQSRTHVTDPSNASRTMLFNIHEGDWDPELLKLFRVPRAILPDVYPSALAFGMAAPGVLGAPVPITGIAGAVVQWLRAEMTFFDSAAEIERRAAVVMDNGGVFLVPAFTGLGAPHWDPHARGTISGITRGTSRAHIARAALEAIAYQSADVLVAMQRDSGQVLSELRVDGGAAANDLLLQFQADILGVPVIRPQTIQTPALGAAYLAGLMMDVWESREQIAARWKAGRTFEPRMRSGERHELMARWHEAVKRSLHWDAPA